MNTLYGQEAKNGDFVLVQDVAYMKGTADIIVAQVHNGKAYAASAVPFKHNSRRWLRKEVAIIVIPITEVTVEEKKLIQMNIEAEKSTFEDGKLSIDGQIALCYKADDEIIPSEYEVLPDAIRCPSLFGKARFPADFWRGQS